MNPFSNPAKGSSFKPNTQKTLKHKYSKDLSKRAAPMGNQGAKAVRPTNAVGISPKLKANFADYNGGRK